MFNYIDAILIFIFFLVLYQGYKRGFILSLLDILALAVSLLMAFYFYLYFATFIDDYIAKVEERWLFPISFFLILIVSRLVFGVVVLKATNQISIQKRKHQINRVAGLVPGFFKAFFITALLSVIFLFFPIWQNLPKHAKTSYFNNYLSQSIEILDQQIAADYSEQIKQSISNLTIEPESDETVYLDFKLEHTLPREELENHLLVLVNQERKKAGLKLLTRDARLKKVARAHSYDMFEKGYFSHMSLSNKSPIDRIKAGGITYLNAGENLALAQTVKFVHLGLMNSPGHKANILNPKFGRIGIGIMDGGIYGLMVTQNFKD